MCPPRQALHLPGPGTPRLTSQAWRARCKCAACHLWADGASAWPGRSLAALGQADPSWHRVCRSKRKAGLWEWQVGPRPGGRRGERDGKAQGEVAPRRGAWTDPGGVQTPVCRLPECGLGSPCSVSRMLLISLPSSGLFLPLLPALEGRPRSLPVLRGGLPPGPSACPFLQTFPRWPLVRHPCQGAPSLTSIRHPTFPFVLSLPSPGPQGAA